MRHRAYLFEGKIPPLYRGFPFDRLRDREETGSGTARRQAQGPRGDWLRDRDNIICEERTLTRVRPHEGETLVELEGVEPSSKQGNHTLSTRLFQPSVFE